MRTPGEGGTTGAAGVAATDTPRARSLREARANAPGGSKAAARLQAFLEQRGLDGGTGPAAGAAPLLLSVRSAGSAGDAAATYQRALAAQPRRREPGPQWQPLGPTSIPRGQTYGSGAGSTPAVSGRVSAIAVDPSQPRHILCGSAGGGVWESTDRGRTWAPRTDGQPCLATGALTFDPSNPRVAYAGTGEGNTGDVPGQGILRSADGGSTWTLTAADAFAGLFFFRLVVDPGDGRRIFAATHKGLFRTTDGGSSWTSVRPGLTWDLSLGAAELLAACEDGLQRSVDGGDTWRKVSLPGGPKDFFNTVGRMAVAHGPGAAGVVYVFAAREDKVWLWRRGRPAGRFEAVTLPSLDPPDAGDPGYGISQSWYDWCLAVPPADPETVILGAVESFRGRRAADGSYTWADISSHAGAAGSMHPDQHTMVVDPSDPRVLYAGNDGGIFRSADQGDTWESLNAGLGITEFEYLAQHPRNASWIIGGTQDNGTLRHRRGTVWDQVAEGDGGDCGIDLSKPSTCYHSFYGMSIERSRDGADTWHDVTPNVPAGAGGLFYPPLEVSGSTVVRAGQHVFVSDDEGDHWTEHPLPKGRPPSAMVFASGSVLLVGCADGRLFRLDRTAAGWGDAVALTSPRPAWVSDLLVQATAPARWWATSSRLGGGHVFRSTDGGASWTDVTRNLGDVPVNAIEADPNDPDVVWLATDAGVYRSSNAGRSWKPFGSGLPRALAVDLLFHARLRRLRVGTRSRGVWEISV